MGWRTEGFRRTRRGRRISGRADAGSRTVVRSCLRPAGNDRYRTCRAGHAVARCIHTLGGRISSQHQPYDTSWATLYTSTLSSTHPFRPRRVSSCPCRVRIRDRRRGPGPGALPEDLARTLARVGRRVERWYARAQHVVSTEGLWIQPLRSNLTPVGFARRLTFALRLEWDAVAAGAGGRPAGAAHRLSWTCHDVAGKSPGRMRAFKSSCRGVRGDASGLMRRRTKCYGRTTSLLEHSHSTSRAIMRGGAWRARWSLNARSRPFGTSEWSSRTRTKRCCCQRPSRRSRLFAAGAPSEPA